MCVLSYCKSTRVVGGGAIRLDPKAASGAASDAAVHARTAPARWLLMARGRHDRGFKCAVCAVLVHDDRIRAARLLQVLQHC